MSGSSTKSADRDFAVGGFMRIFCSETEVRCNGKCYEAGGSIPTGNVMRRQFGLFVATAVAIALAWWWLGRPVALPSAAADPGGIPCLSYAPFRGDQSPLVASTHVEAWKHEEDLAKPALLRVW